MLPGLVVRAIGLEGGRGKHTVLTHSMYMPVPFSTQPSLALRASSSTNVAIKIRADLPA